MNENELMKELYSIEIKIIDVRDKIVAAIEARIQLEADEGKRLAHVAGREIIRHFFHGMEGFFGIFPRYGKLFSTVWKNRLRGRKWA